MCKSFEEEGVTSSFRAIRMPELPHARADGHIFPCTAPGKTPVTHIFMVKDERLGVFGEVTLQTDDEALAAKFAAHDGASVSLVLSISQ